MLKQRNISPRLNIAPTPHLKKRRPKIRMFFWVEGLAFVMVEGLGSVKIIRGLILI